MKIIIFSNSYWNITNLRRELINSLIRDSHKLVLIYDKKKDNDLFDIDCAHYNINLPNKLFSFTKTFGLLIKLYRILKNERPDIVINFTIQPIILSSLVSIFLNFRFMNVFTGLGSIFIKNNYQTKIIMLVYKFISVFCTFTVFQNKKDQSFFLSHKLVKKNFHVIYGSGVNTKKFNKMPLNKNIDFFTFIFVGRIIKDKGILDYIDSANLVTKKNDKIKFMIVGDFDYDNPTSISKQHFLSKIESNKNIQFIGYKSNIKEFIGKAHCVVLPSYREGLPMSLLEASAIGRPIIATNVPGCNDVVIDNKSGYLVNVRDKIDLSNKMLKIAALSYSHLNQMAEFNRLRAEKLFSIDKINLCYKDLIYENI